MKKWLGALFFALVLVVAGWSSAAFADDPGDGGIGSVEFANDDPGDGGIGDIGTTSYDPGDGGIG